MLTMRGKKALAWLMTVAMLVGMLPATAFAAEDGQHHVHKTAGFADGVYYTGECTFTEGETITSSEPDQCTELGKEEAFEDSEEEPEQPHEHTSDCYSTTTTEGSYECEAYPFITVNFENDGQVVGTARVVQGYEYYEAAPAVEQDGFDGWADENGTVVDYTQLTSDTTLYALYSVQVLAGEGQEDPFYNNGVTVEEYHFMNRGTFESFFLSKANTPNGAWVEGPSVHIQVLANGQNTAKASQMAGLKAPYFFNTNALIVGTAAPTKYVQPAADMKFSASFTYWYLKNGWILQRGTASVDFSLEDVSYKLYNKNFMELYFSDEPDAPQQYNVIFDRNTGAEDDYNRVSVDAGEPVEKPVDPVWAEHEFLGWYTEASGGEQYKFDTPVTGNITLYAQWKTENEPDYQYTMTLEYHYDNNGASGEPVERDVLIDSLDLEPYVNKVQSTVNDGEIILAITPEALNEDGKFDYTDFIFDPLSNGATLKDKGKDERALMTFKGDKTATDVPKMIYTKAVVPPVEKPEFIHVTKTISGISMETWKEKAKDFTITITGPNDYKKVLTLDNIGENVGTIERPNVITWQVRDLPATGTYTFVESNYNVKSYQVKTLAEGKEGVSAEVELGKNSTTIAFVNTYEIEKPQGFNVSYKINGETPNDPKAEDYTGIYNKDVPEGTPIRVKDAPISVSKSNAAGAIGYWTFNGWKADTQVELKEAVGGGVEFNMPGQEVVFTGSWTFHKISTPPILFWVYTGKGDNTLTPEQLQARMKSEITHTSNIASHDRAEYTQVGTADFGADLKAKIIETNYRSMRADFYHKDSDSYVKSDFASLKMDFSTYIDKNAEFDDFIWYVFKSPSNNIWHVDGIPKSTLKTYSVTYEMGDHGNSTDNKTISKLNFGQNTPAYGEKDPTSTTGNYVFTGWREKGTGAPWSETVTKDVTYVAQWRAADAFNYSVGYYYENVDGTYSDGATKSDQRAGTYDGQSIEITENDKKPDTDKVGFVLDESKNENWKGTIQSGSKPELKVYFKRILYTVTYEPGQHGNFSEEKHENLRYETQTPAYNKGATPVSKTNGYHFTGWKEKDSDATLAPTVTKSVVYVAQWAETTDYDYKVGYYYQQDDGTYKESTENYQTRSGTYIDQQVDITDKDKEATGEGYALDENQNKAWSGKIEAGGKTELKVYFKKQLKVTYQKGTQGTFEEKSYDKLDFGVKTPSFEGTTTGNSYYTFAGWRAEGATTNGVAETVTKNTVYVAQWSYNGGDDGDEEDPYTPPEEDIPDNKVPQGGGPDTGTSKGNDGNGEIDILEPEVPLTSAPEIEDIIIIDEEVPLGNLPKTGTAPLGVDPTALGLLTWASAMAVWGLGGKKEKDTDEE